MTTATTIAPAVADPTQFRKMQWRMLFAVMLCYAFYYTGRQNFGWATAALIHEFGFTPAAVGLINGGMLLLYGVGQAINGNLGDAIGARRMMPLGAALSFALNWIVSFTHSFNFMFLGWSLNGYAQSLGFASGGRLIANWWSDRARGRVFGLYLFAAGASSVITYAICIWVLTAFSWRYVFRIPVLLLLVAGAIFAIVARDSPEQSGFQATRTVDSETAPLSWIDRYAPLFSNRKFLLACVTIGCESAARYGLLTWAPLVYLGPNWKSNPAGLWITLALPVGMALGALACGYLSDRFFGCNRSRPIAIFLGLAAISSFLLYAAPSHHVLFRAVVLFLAGFFVFGPQSSFWALCPDLLGRQRTATGIGVMDACAYACAAASEPLYGLCIQTIGTANVVFLLTGVLCAIGAACIIAVKR